MTQIVVKSNEAAFMSHPHEEFKTHGLKDSLLMTKTEF